MSSHARIFILWGSWQAAIVTISCIGAVYIESYPSPGKHVILGACSQRTGGQPARTCVSQTEGQITFTTAI